MSGSARSGRWSRTGHPQPWSAELVQTSTVVRAAPAAAARAGRPLPPRAVERLRAVLRQFCPSPRSTRLPLAVARGGARLPPGTSTAGAGPLGVDRVAGTGGASRSWQTSTAPSSRSSPTATAPVPGAGSASSSQTWPKTPPVLRPRPADAHVVPQISRAPGRRRSSYWAWYGVGGSRPGARVEQAWHILTVHRAVTSLDTTKLDGPLARCCGTTSSTTPRSSTPCRRG